jgi:hypothetical protein
MQALHTFWQLDFGSFFLVNQAYMILLRKKLDAVCVQDFGSIHSMSKLITKTPWMRLAPHIRSLVMPNQSAFINGCVLHDNFRTVQLSAKLLHAQRFPAVLLKIDIAKAFDTAHGLRQGDLLSSLLLVLAMDVLLLVLAMDVLNALFKHADESRLLTPLQPRVMKYRVFLYADDLVIFLAPILQDVRAVRAILDIFAASSGLCTNVAKCSLSPIRCT